MKRMLPRKGSSMPTDPERRRKTLYAAMIAVFVILSLLAAWLIGRPLVRYMGQPQHFRSWVARHGLLGRLVFVGMFFIQVVIAIIPGEVLELGAGYAFGFLEGTLLCQTGILLGSAVVFGFVRRFGSRAAAVFFPPEKIRTLRFLSDERRLQFWVFLLFFIPGTPKDLLTYVVPLTEMKASRFLIIAAVARIPSLVTSTWGGDALGTGRLLFAGIVFAATALLSLGGLLLYRRVCRIKMAHTPDTGNAL